MFRKHFSIQSERHWTGLWLSIKSHCNVEICSSRQSIQIYYNLSDICNLHVAQMGRTTATVLFEMPKIKLNE